MICRIEIPNRQTKGLKGYKGVSRSEQSDLPVGRVAKTSSPSALRQFRRNVVEGAKSLMYLTGYTCGFFVTPSSFAQTLKMLTTELFSTTKAVYARRVISERREFPCTSRVVKNDFLLRISLVGLQLRWSPRKNPQRISEDTPPVFSQSPPRFVSTIKMLTTEPFFTTLLVASAFGG
jgi:hypothetical protein